MSTFEQVRDSLQKLHTLLVRGEPTPDEETESKDKILQFLKVIQQSPEGDRVKDLVQQAITLASGWDVYDLWFKEVNELPVIIDKILTMLKPALSPVPPAPKERPAEKIEPSVVAPMKAPVESPAASSAGADLEAIVAKVADQFKSQIQELKGKISSLEKNLDDKDVEIEKGKQTNEKLEAAAGSGVERPQIKSKLLAPKLKIPPVPANKPLSPRFEEKPVPSIPAPVEEAAPPQPMKPLAVKPISIKPVIIAPSVVEKPAVVHPSIPKPVPVRQMIPKPVSIRPVVVGPAEEPANLQPIPVKVAAGRPVLKGVTIKPISVQPVSIKPISVNVAPIESPEFSMEPEAPSNLQPISPRPVSIKPISVAPGTPRQIFIKPVGIQAQPVSPTPFSAQPVAVKPVSIQPVSGSIRPVSIAPAGPITIKPISAQPVGIKPVSTMPQSSPGSNLASALSSIGRSPQPAPESMISVRPIAASPAATAAGVDLNATLPESKTDLYSELIALEGRRFATERRRKELDDQREKGQLGQVEYQNSAGRAEMDLQGIATRINSIRQKLSTL